MLPKLIHSLGGIMLKNIQFAIAVLQPIVVAFLRATDHLRCNVSVGVGALSIGYPASAVADC